MLFRAMFAALVGAAGCAGPVAEPAPAPVAPVDPEPRVARPPHPRPGPRARPAVDGAGCEVGWDCASHHCCLTSFGGLCAEWCTFADVGAPVIGEICLSNADCPTGTCESTSTAGRPEVRTCR